MFGALVVANLVFWMYREARTLGSKDRLADLPDVMLWAWERPEDLRFLDCRQTGVAYLAETVILDRGGITLRPRLQPLLISEGCAVVAVVRVEAAPETVVAGALAGLAGLLAQPGDVSGH